MNTGSGYQTVFTGGTSGQGASITIDLPAGTIPFRYVTGPDPAHPEGPFTTTNGVNASAAGAHFFLGVDPYLASGTYQTSGTSVFVGLTDRPHGSGEDHDFQDLTILVQAAPLVVPEPATATTALFLIGAGCVGVIRRRLQARHSATGAAAHS